MNAIKPIFMLSLAMFLSHAGDEAMAAAYKCVDANGKVAYSDAPCPGQSGQPGAPAKQQKLFERGAGYSELNDQERAQYQFKMLEICQGPSRNRPSPAACQCLATEAAARAKYEDYKLIMERQRSPAMVTRLMGILEDSVAACNAPKQANRAGSPGAPAPGNPAAGDARNPASLFDSADPKVKQAGNLAGTGTGFLVSAAGHVLTNAHVVNQCKEFRAKHATGEVVTLTSISVDNKLDLALLKGSFISPVQAAPFRKQEPPLGESIVVFGFPLTGTLAASGNLTTGTLSGLAGVQNDADRYQISAPVQPGNSGGAVLDESGLVIGVVQSKLNAARMQMVSGDIAQNVNFAVKGKLAQTFLGALAIPMAVKEQQAARKVSAIAEEATKFSVLIGCFR